MRYSIVQGMLLWGLTSALPAAEKPVARGLDLVATADVYVVNDYPTDLTVSSVSGKMDKSLPQSFVVPHGQTCPPQRVEATFFPFVQSTFGMTLHSTPKASNFNFRLGKIAEKTGVSAGGGNPPFEAAAVLAPQNPLSGSPDYNFYVLGGQNMLAPIINNLISSKIPALAAGLAKNPLKPALPIKGVSVAINGIPTKIQAVYAGVKNLAASPINANAVITVTGSVTGSLHIDALNSDVPFKVDLTNLSILANADVTLAASISAKVNSFATSLDAVNISSELLGALNNLTPGFLKFLHAADDICGILNTDLNSKVLELVNGAISNLGSLGLAKRDIDNILEDLIKRSLEY